MREVGKALQQTSDWIGSQFRIRDRIIYVHCCKEEKPVWVMRLQ
jgi:hypothetical protein